MNGSPLTPAYGAPARVSASVKLGYKMVKYLTDIVFLPEATGAYWEDRGYEWFGGVRARRRPFPVYRASKNRRISAKFIVDARSVK
jgi:DMSO/TMAO reductase YedYZ molybdopterin-dependent catalytic subunit